jgi:hypothetical protein
VSAVPAPAAASDALPSSSASGDLRGVLLARVRWAAARAWDGQDAELEAEIAALEAAGDCLVPTVASGLADYRPVALSCTDKQGQSGQSQG